MKFMDKATSWKLFSKTVFGDEFCPLELEDIGKKIVEGCRGLPLSIVVVGGLLSKSEPTRENWQVIEENLRSFVNLEDEGSCLQILYMCYNNMPVHLKPCFLYMYIGVYPEDREIPVPLLVQLMVAEGFIKPIDGKSLEEAAEEYLEELVDRNLVFAGQRNEYGKLETCKIHNLLRDLALREGEKEEFSYWLEQNKSRGDREISQGMASGQRRITNLFGDEDTSSVVVLGSVEVAAGSALVRSLIGRFPAGTLALPSSRLLRVCFVEEESSDEYCEETSIPLLNLRFLLVHAEEIPSYLWNLQALLLLEVDKDYVLEIWKMPLLRLVITHNALCLPNPPPVGNDEVVLENLHSLYLVRNLKLSEEVLKRIPNIRILKLCYQPEEEEEEEEEEEQEEEQEEEEDYSLNNLHRLNKLQELDLIIWYGWNLPSIQELSLPYSLKQLTLRGTKLPWEEMASKIGCLPLLQVLRTGFGAFIGSEWETVEGQFLSLKFLKIESSHDLESWMTDKSHFPCLERLVLRLLSELREIPSSIGDIPTLKSIKVEYCSDSAKESARRMQEECDSQVLQIQVK